jgi:opacity protein-like surface antigen
MRRFLLLLPLLWLSTSAVAQETPKVEVFGGYSNLSANVNASSFNLNGFDTSVAENVNSWFGGALDFSAHFGTENGFSVNTESLSYGPVFSYRKNHRVTPFGHILLGAVRGGPEFLNISKAETRFGMYAGGGLDVKITPLVALRLIQADYLLTAFSNTTQDNFRLSAGIVLRFGKK